MMELVVFVIAGGVCLAGAIGVVASRNPVHAALSLVATLFGVAVLFVAQEANFLAAVQVIVYAGAIVVLFLFVIMFLGVDRAENLRVEPLGAGQRIAGALLGVGVVALVLAALADTSFEATGARNLVAPLASGDTTDIRVLGESIFTRYVYAFELTSVLLVIAVVGAVVMASRPRAGEEITEPGQAEREAAIEDRIVRAELRAEGYTDEDMAAAQAAQAAEEETAASAESASVGAGTGAGGES